MLIMLQRRRMGGDEENRKDVTDKAREYLKQWDGHPDLGVGFEIYG